MKIRFAKANSRRRLAFTLPEALVSVGIVGTMFVSLYAGVSQGFSVITAAREDLRATQIMLEKVEILRLYTWDQINTTNFIPTAFADRLVPPSAGGGTNGSGTLYTGSIAISTPSVDTNYNASLKDVSITVSWTTGNITRSRSMRTFIGQNGLQQYVY